MVVLLRSTDGNPDSRYEKYIDFLKEQEIDYLSLCWDRNLNKHDNKKHIYYHVQAKYGDGVSNLKKLLGFNYFLLKKLIKNRKKYKVIHAADFDTVLPAVFMHIFFRKRIIYDIYDWYIDSRAIKNCFIKYLILFLEFICIKSSDKVIICEQERKKQIIFTPKDLWVLPNIPNYGNFLLDEKKNECLTISYVGILGYERGLDKLIRYAKETPTIKLNIAGFGPLECLLKDLSSYPNIYFYGSVNYHEALRIMNSSDVIYAVYETSNPNHILAAPNKYYEGLYLGKPIITTKGTIVGTKTEKFKTGFVIGESYDDLCRMFEYINEHILDEYAMNAKMLWKEKYSNYVRNFLEDIYLSYLRSL